MNIYSDGEVKMKVCVTATAGDLNAQVDPQLGRCQYFVLVEQELGEVKMKLEELKRG